MNREDYFKFHEEMTRKMNEITRAKNADYTGAAGDDPFANFNRVNSLGVCTTEQGFMVRMLDKYMRINSFVQKGFLNVKDESVEDTLLDLANYAILFAGYLKSQRPNATSESFAGETTYLKPITAQYGFANAKRCYLCSKEKNYLVEGLCASCYEKKFGRTSPIGFPRKPE